MLKMQGGNYSITLYCLILMTRVLEKESCQPTASDPKKEKALKGIYLHNDLNSIASNVGLLPFSSTTFVPVINLAIDLPVKASKKE